MTYQLFSGYQLFQQTRAIQIVHVRHFSIDLGIWYMMFEFPPNKLLSFIGILIYKFGL